jgi:hypothetical protein
MRNRSTDQSLEQHPLQSVHRTGLARGQVGNTTHASKAYRSAPNIECSQNWAG